MKLRTDQRNAVDHVVHGKSRSVLIVAPTATGKTPILAEIARHYVARKKSVLVLAHREELLKQAADHLSRKDLTVGLIKSGWKHLEDPSAPVQVASVASLVRRDVNAFDVILIDEAHRASAKTYRKILEASPKAKIVGFTATPISANDNVPLSTVFEDLYESLTPAQALERGLVSPCIPESKVLVTPSFADVKRRGGDFDDRQIGELMSKRLVIGDIVKTWKKNAKGRSTILFAATRKQAKKTARAFIKAGIRAEYLDGKTRDERRAEVLARFSAGEFPVLCNVGLFTEGTDIPRVKCIVLARPTYSLTLFLQMVGRGRRLWGGQNCIIHDHGGLFGMHQSPDDERDWSLGGKSKGKELVICPNGHPRPIDMPKCPEGCTFPGHSGDRDPAIVLRGYEYDAEQFLAARDSKIQEIRRLHEEGLSALKLGKMFGVSASSVARWITLSGGKARTIVEASVLRHTPAPAVLEKARQMYLDGGMSISNVCSSLGIDKETFKGWARRYGWRLRSHAEACKLTGTKAGPDSALLERVQRMYDGHKMSTSNIDTALNLVPGTAKRWLRRSGHKMRSCKDAKFLQFGNNMSIIERARKMYEHDGYSIHFVAEKLGIGFAQAYNWAKRFGWKMRSRRDAARILADKRNDRSAPLRERAREMYEGGRGTVVQVANAVGVSQPTINRWVRRFGWRGRSTV